jgi:phosphoribosylformylglycinamidine cyclo-ligase
VSSPTSPGGLRYRDAGVDIDAADEALERARGAIRATFNDRVLADVGSFGGLFRADGLGREPVLVGTTDGVGTKTRVAAAVRRFDTVGRCLVQHCINDALVQGARPLFFLDYVAMGKLDPDVVGTVIAGCAEACRASGLALIVGTLKPERVAALIGGVAAACKDHGTVLLGGETAEMPGVYSGDDFDLVGTLVGVVEREHLLDGSRVRSGDALIGLRSDGLHTNGYSLARRIVEERMGIAWTDPFPGDPLGRDAAAVLLQNHRCYLPVLDPWLQRKELHAMAHITGSGVPGNLPRVLQGMGARVSRAAVPVQNVFARLVEAGGVPRDEAWSAFNMGVGMILVVEAAAAAAIQSELRARGEESFLMGEVAGDLTEVAWLD